MLVFLHCLVRDSQHRAQETFLCLLPKPQQQMVSVCFYNRQYFCTLFEKVYLSHELGLRKPHTEVFTHIIEEQGLVASETLFIDDSIQHVEGAIKAGLHAHHLTDDQTIDQLFP